MDSALTSGHQGMDTARGPKWKVMRFFLVFCVSLKGEGEARGVSRHLKSTKSGQCNIEILCILLRYSGRNIMA